MSTQEMVRTLIAGCIPDPAMRTVVAEDLIEEHAAIREQRGRQAAAAWLISQLVRSFPRLPLLSTQRNESCMSLSSALSFYGILLALTIVATAVSLAMARASAFAERGFQDALLLLTSSLAVAAAAGFLAACIVRRVPIVGALTLGVASVGIGIAAMLLGEAHGPVWYWPLLELLVIPTTLAGALLRVRHAPLS